MLLPFEFGFLSLFSNVSRFDVMLCRRSCGGNGGLFFGTQIMSLRVGAILLNILIGRVFHENEVWVVGPG